MPHALHESAAVRESAVGLGERRGGEDYVRGLSRLGQEKLLHDEQVEARERVRAAFEVRGEEAARDVHRAHFAPRGVEDFERVQRAVHQSEVVHADAVVVERQRV